MPRLDLLAAFGEGAIALGVESTDARHAIGVVGELLVTSGRTKPEYTRAMIDALDEFGPYFVIAPGIAIAHARPSEAVLQVGLALAVLSEPLAFGSQANDPVRLVFGLCAHDHDSHLSVLSELAEVLIDPACVNILLNASTEQQIRDALA